jgi:hypothetical protein
VAALAERRDAGRCGGCHRGDFGSCACQMFQGYYWRDALRRPSDEASQSQTHPKGGLPSSTNLSADSLSRHDVIDDGHRRH